jgi:hypothetical protein
MAPPARPPGPPTRARRQSLASIALIVGEAAVPVKPVGTFRGVARPSLTDSELTGLNRRVINAFDV